MGDGVCGSVTRHIPMDTGATDCRSPQTVAVLFVRHESKNQLASSRARVKQAVLVGSYRCGSIEGSIEYDDRARGLSRNRSPTKHQSIVSQNRPLQLL
jgi:hypothetical protein